MSNSNPLKKKLDARAKKYKIITGQIMGRLTDSQKKSPSQRKSEAGRKRLLRGGTSPSEYKLMFDCRDCLKYPCGGTLLTCGERAFTSRCAHCGQIIMYRVLEERWTHCPVCREMVGIKKPELNKPVIPDQNSNLDNKTDST